ncbi:hypothetical protein PNA2_1569 [Pyrococcus sp. NA2]|uniref:aminopeptidase n=1 Tax=Pyrococcus sp. (strain NA2) TaxID=342949 RepID=UPI000209A93A|nr:aminopeptidase [Pyrococcus sp. NA2]AEC52484.1 hypothetical protein PNA2_1569 [Pyrococcus sp. NA2]
MEEEKLANAARVLVREVISLKKGEKLLIISDFEGKRIVEAILREALKVGGKPYHFSFMPTRRDFLPPAISGLIEDSDAIILVSSVSLSFSKEVWTALKEEKRVVSCPRTNEDMFCRALSVDPKKLSNETRKVASLLSEASSLEIMSNGRKFKASISEREAIYVDGLANKPGKFTIIPGGIIGIAPIEGTPEGGLVINGSISHMGPLTSEIKLKVEKGKIVEISGGEDAKKFEKLLESYGDENMFKIAEIGVGVHPMMRIRGNATEDESARGAVIIGIGENVGHLKGNIKAPDHIDLAIWGASLKVDNRWLVIHGALEV